MGLHKINSRAISLKSHVQGELNRILELFTEEHGLVRAIAYGIRKPGSRFGSIFESGSLLYFSASNGRSSDLLAVRDGELIEPFINIKQDYTLTIIMLEFLSDLRKLLRWNQTERQLFNESVSLLEQLNKGELNGFMFKTISKMSLLKSLGLLPDWLHCVKCGKPSYPLILLPNVQTGGFCRNCLNGRHNGTVLDAGLCKVLDFYSNYNTNSGADYRLTYEQKGVIEALQLRFEKIINNPF